MSNIERLILQGAWMCKSVGWVLLFLLYKWKFWSDDTRGNVTWNKVLVMEKFWLGGGIIEKIITEVTIQRSSQKTQNQWAPKYRSPQISLLLVPSIHPATPWHSFRQLVYYDAILTTQSSWYSPVSLGITSTLNDSTPHDLCPMRSVLVDDWMSDFHAVQRS